MKNLKEKLWIFIKWVFMWSCDTIPWISWWTIAFITGIYERLINSLNAIDIEFLKMIFKLNLKKAWKKIDWTFLIILLLWIITAILFLANLIHYLLENHRIMIWSFFFWLIIASAYILLKHIKKRKKNTFFLLILWTISAFLITSITLWKTPTNLVFIFFTWMLGILAMILPGISWSYILLIIWKYNYIISIISQISSVIKSTPSKLSQWKSIFWILSNIQTELLILWIFGIWAVVWLIMFSKIIHWLFQKFYYQIIALLTWFMIWSLNKIWPWKADIWSDQVKNILPSIDASLIYPILLILFGMILVLSFDIIKEKLSKNNL